MDIKDRNEILSGKKILVCEDHAINAHILLALLEKAGMTGVLASDGRQGVELFSESDENEFSAIIMDILMPVMNGIEAAKAVRALDRCDAKTIPIIAMTADDSPEDIRSAVAAGMNEYAVKPVDPQRFYDMLCDLISDHADRI